MAKINPKVKGLDDVLKNLSKEVQGIEGRTEKGLKAAGLFIQAESIERTPVKFGVLANSSFVSTAMALAGPVLRVGYTALYAPFVHESPETNNFTKIGTGPKFLEKAVKNNVRKILEIIRNRAKI